MLEVGKEWGDGGEQQEMWWQDPERPCRSFYSLGFILSRIRSQRKVLSWEESWFILL